MATHKLYKFVKLQPLIRKEHSRKDHDKSYQLSHIRDYLTVHRSDTCSSCPYMFRFS